MISTWKPQKPAFVELTISGFDVVKEERSKRSGIPKKLLPIVSLNLDESYLTFFKACYYLSLLQDTCCNIRDEHHNLAFTHQLRCIEYILNEFIKREQTPFIQGFKSILNDPTRITSHLRLNASQYLWMAVALNDLMLFEATISTKADVNYFEGDKSVLQETVSRSFFYNNYLMIKVLIEQGARTAHKLSPSAMNQIYQKVALDGATQFNVLSDPLLLACFSYLSIKDMPAVSGVCKKWLEVSSSNSHWFNFYRQSNSDATYSPNVDYKTEVRNNRF